MTALANLLPCPFCGGSDLFGTSNGLNSSFIECNTCGASGPVYDDEDSDVAAWNRRATLSPAELGGVEEAVAKLTVYADTNAITARIHDVAHDLAPGTYDLYATPRADEAVTEEMVYRAARSLNDRNADECNVDREDSWKIYGDSYREDARAALTAALSPPSPGAAK